MEMCRKKSRESKNGEKKFVVYCVYVYKYYGFMWFHFKFMSLVAQNEINGEQETGCFAWILKRVCWVRGCGMREKVEVEWRQSSVKVTSKHIFSTKCWLFPGFAYFLTSLMHFILLFRILFVLCYLFIHSFIHFVSSHLSVRANCWC